MTLSTGIERVWLAPSAPSNSTHVAPGCTPASSSSHAALEPGGHAVGGRRDRPAHLLGRGRNLERSPARAPRDARAGEGRAGDHRALAEEAAPAVEVLRVGCHAPPPRDAS